jgi:hypothetical protein
MMQVRKVSMQEVDLEYCLVALFLQLALGHLKSSKDSWE